MLVLTRKKDQSIVIDDERIVIKVLDAQEGITRLGIEAPKDVSVHRKEIYNRIKKEK